MTTPPSELEFRPRATRRKNDPWFAWTMLAIGALALSNAAWFYNWRERAVQHAEQLRSATAARQEPRVVHEYRGRAESGIYTPQQQRTLGADEECKGGVVIRRSVNTLESTGERC